MAEEKKEELKTETPKVENQQDTKVENKPDVNNVENKTDVVKEESKDKVDNKSEKSSNDVKDKKDVDTEKEELSAIDKIKDNVNAGTNSTQNEDKEEKKENNGLEMQIKNLLDKNERLQDLINSQDLRIKQLEESFANLSKITDEDKEILSQRQPDNLGNNSGMENLGKSYYTNNAKSDLFNRFGTSKGKPNFDK